jgi:iron-sulfur cluster repair protein YtfE (RIC family)
VDGYSTTSPVDLIDEFNPTDSKVCLTGKFLCGSRRQCESDLLKLGCQIVDRVTQDLDYLIIGALSSKDWKFQSFGRKIEQAIDYRDNKGVPLKILSEEHWQTLMRDNNSYLKGLQMAVSKLSNGKWQAQVFPTVGMGGVFVANSPPRGSHGL